MQVFRIGRAPYIRDLSGTGASRLGGRWNHPGVSVVYTASSRSLATVEYLVHVPAGLLPEDLHLAVLDLPDPLPSERIDPADLPPHWRVYPPPPELAELGSAWARSSRSFMLRVPSAVVEGEDNILLNPAHPAIEQVILSEIRPYIFDQRLVP